MKNLEIVYLSVAYGMGFIIYFINRNKDYLTVSETAANNKIGRQAFFWGLLVSGIIFELLMFMWVIPHYQFGYLVSVLAVILFIFQIITGIIPARGKGLNVAHQTTAFGLATTMVVIIAIFALQYSLPSYVRILCLLLALIMVSIVASTHKLTSSKYFRYQNIFFACWHIAFFVVVYFG